MKKIPILLIFLFVSCEKSPLFEAYDSVEGTWKIINIVEQKTTKEYPNATIFFNSCKYLNKNLKNGNHACIGKITFNEGVLSISYKMESLEKITIDDVATSDGSTDPKKTTLPMLIFSKTWKYTLEANKLKLENTESNTTILLEKVSQ